jgi:hypothetical protein
VQNNAAEVNAAFLDQRGDAVAGVSWFSVKWRVALLGKLLNSAAARREFSRHGVYRSMRSGPELGKRERGAG